MCMRLFRVVWMVRRIKRNESRFCVVNWVAEEGKTAFFHTRKNPIYKHVQKDDRKGRQRERKQKTSYQ